MGKQLHGADQGLSQARFEQACDSGGNANYASAGTYWLCQEGSITDEQGNAIEVGGKFDGNGMTTCDFASAATYQTCDFSNCKSGFQADGDYTYPIAAGFQCNAATCEEAGYQCAAGSSLSAGGKIYFVEDAANSVGGTW